MKSAPVTSAGMSDPDFESDRSMPASMSLEDVRGKPLNYLSDFCDCWEDPIRIKCIADARQASPIQILSKQPDAVRGRCRCPWGYREFLDATAAARPLMPANRYRRSMEAICPEHSIPAASSRSR